MSAPARRGWRESFEKHPGLYRIHSVNCPSTKDEKPNRRCECPWKAAISRGGGKTSQQTFAAATLTEAAREKARRQDAALRRRTAGGDILFGDFFEHVFLRDHNPPFVESTKDGYRAIYKGYLAERFGGLRLSDITREALDAYVAELTIEGERRRLETGKRNAQYVSQRVAPLSSALGSAFAWRRIDHNPAEGLQMPFIDPTRDDEEPEDARKVLDRAQLELLFAHAAGTGAGWDRVPPHRNEALLRVAFELALRQGEFRGLTWARLDLEAGIAHITHQVQVCKTKPDGRSWEVRRLKGKQSRPLPMTPELIEFLTRYRDELKAYGAYSPKGFVFAGENGPGAPLSKPACIKVVRKAVLRAGLVDDRGRPLITSHGLRHSLASHMLGQGVPLLIVSRYLGHASISITEKTYAHLVNTHDQLNEVATMVRALFHSAPAGAARAESQQRGPVAAPERENPLAAFATVRDAVRGRPQAVAS